jgi:hypothetical protein
MVETHRETEAKEKHQTIPSPSSVFWGGAIRTALQGKTDCLGDGQPLVAAK